jgi:serine/threonine protein kinase
MGRSSAFSTPHSSESSLGNVPADPNVNYFATPSYSSSSSSAPAAKAGMGAKASSSSSSSSSSSLLQPPLPGPRLISRSPSLVLMDQEEPSQAQAIVDSTSASIPHVGYYDWLAQRPASTPSSQQHLLDTFATVNEHLGRGAFSTAMKCVHRLDGCVYAVKVFNEELHGEAHMHRVFREVYALAALPAHPCVLRYYGAWVEQGRLHVQTELCAGGSLQDKLLQEKESELSASSKGLFDEDGLVYVLQCVLLALTCIHAKNIAHMDVKPANILLDVEAKSSSSKSSSSSSRQSIMGGFSGLYKLADFGLATVATSANKPDVEDGDSVYLAPEMLQPLGAQADITKADIFSLGVTMIQLALGGRHEMGKNGEQWQRIREGQAPELKGCSSEFASLVAQMIRPDAQHRPTAAQLLERVQSIYFAAAAPARAPSSPSGEAAPLNSYLLTQLLSTKKELQELKQQQQQQQP